MITLASDFGSPYPAAMKGVILQRTDARLVDVAHDLPRQDVRAAAFWLREVLPWFPPAVHLVVVDPGVGTDRAAVVVRAGDHALVGPDNGVLLPAARRLADAFEVFEVAVDDPASTTFHGRDVFAPAAAAVHEAGVADCHALDDLSPADEFVDLAFPDADVDAGSATGEVLVVDDFGNSITNVPGDVLDDRFGETVTVDGESAPVRRTYAAVAPGQRLVTVGSHGNVELAVNQGRGDDAFGVEPGDRVRLTFADG
ncbi:S-adenosyl-l-methionine hydroxide adenosyltransferase family protein [Halobacteriaceae archaeon GCM10025711]